ncbi:hypothetical protein Q3G72_001337 [Acer saccharum]|nr:hypothetical protein Q3G72_001337 [Acer saccharum]
MWTSSILLEVLFERLFSLRKVFGSIQEENSISVSSLKDRGLGKVDKPQQIPKVSSLKDRGPGKETNRGTNCSLLVLNRDFPLSLKRGIHFRRSQDPYFNGQQQRPQPRTLNQRILRPKLHWSSIVKATMVSL